MNSVASMDFGQFERWFNWCKRQCPPRPSETLVDWASRLAKVPGVSGKDALLTAILAGGCASEKG